MNNLAAHRTCPTLAAKRFIHGGGKETRLIRYARNVHFRIKEGKDQEIVRLMNTELLPLLKKQDGFLDELMMLDGRRAVAISLWADRKHAESYQSSLYPEVLKKLTPFLDGAPKVETFDVPMTTVTH